MLIGIAGGPITGIIALAGGGFVAAAWAWLIRHNQRSALGRVDEVARTILEPLVSDS